MSCIKNIDRNNSIKKKSLAQLGIEMAVRTEKSVTNHPGGQFVYIRNVISNYY